MANINLRLSVVEELTCRVPLLQISSCLTTGNSNEVKLASASLVLFEHGCSKVLPFQRVWSVLWLKLKLFGTETSVCKPEKAHCDDFLGLLLVFNMAAMVQQTEGAWDGVSKQEEDSLQVVFRFLGFTMALYTWNQSDTKLVVFHCKRGLKAHFFCQLFMCCFTVWAT